MTRSLGTCRQPAGQGECGGLILVDRESLLYEEGVCDRCQCEYARPKGRLGQEPETEPERDEIAEEDEPWWFK